MCYNYAADFPATGRNPLAGRYFSLEDQLELFDPVVDGLSYRNVVTIRAKPGKDDLEVVRQEWGFAPSYIRNRDELGKLRWGYKEGNSFIPQKVLLNAKGEELLMPNKRIYKDAARERRCLVPATGFYEYFHHYPIGKRGQKLKTFNSYPYHVWLPDSPIFYFAGIWQNWVNQDDGESVETLAIVTTAANERMAKIHNDKKRMPVILPPPQAEEWVMAPQLTDSRLLDLASFQYDTDSMAAHTIDKNYKSSPLPKTEVKYRELDEPPNWAPTLF